MAFQLAISYRKDGRFDDSIKLLEHTFETEKRILGEEHPRTKDTAIGLEETYRERWEGTSP
jgi:hypothetical protein